MLLTVLFMAALLVIGLAVSLPRQAFEGQRQREDDLIYRGRQYSRAVELYFRKFKRYPANLEDLENTNNVRFLRRRYVDPITKESEWRVIHIGPAGVFTDSLVYDQAKPETKDGQQAAGTPAPGGAVAPEARRADRAAGAHGSGRSAPCTRLADGHCQSCQSE